MSAVFVSLDPGQRTGVAVWSASNFKRLEPPLSVALWTAGPGCKDWTWAQRCVALAHKFDALFKWQTVVKVYCELPAFFEGEKGHAAAAKGDVVKLAYLVGVYAGMCHKRGVEFNLVPVREWKGQLPKSVVISRIQKRLGSACGIYKADQWDAVGIGLFIKGCF